MDIRVFQFWGFEFALLSKYEIKIHGSFRFLPFTTITKEDMRLPLLSFEESASTNLSRAKDGLTRLMERPVYTIHSLWRRFDDVYMRRSDREGDCRNAAA
ncbi:hypothetical protein SASPL_132883 [Salvia splendens]|uniref:Uncharacterized protein n=1 Tax=Salvia splendens TaxID=180675 RepID=A0A8X8ZHT1_SALSN|nr:hypothetical protein SASPL_132883 [Salvia splendens]